MSYNLYILYKVNNYNKIDPGILPPPHHLTTPQGLGRGGCGGGPDDQPRCPAHLQRLHEGPAGQRECVDCVLGA